MLGIGQCHSGQWRLLRRPVALNSTAAAGGHCAGSSAPASAHHPRRNPYVNRSPRGILDQRAHRIVRPAHAAATAATVAPHPRSWRPRPARKRDGHQPASAWRDVKGAARTRAPPGGTLPFRNWNAEAACPRPHFPVSSRKSKVKMHPIRDSRYQEAYAIRLAHRLYWCRISSPPVVGQSVWR